MKEFRISLFNGAELIKEIECPWIFLMDIMNHLEKTNYIVQVRGTVRPNSPTIQLL